MTDATAAGGARMVNPNRNAAKLTDRVADPANYFEMTFNAEAGEPYRLWMRGKAENNVYSNDSVFVQFSDSVTCRRRAAVAHRHDVGRRSQPRRLQRLRRLGLGLAGQRLGRRRAGRPRVLRDDRPADASRPDARRRLLDRPDRAVAGSVPVGITGRA